VNPYYVVKHWLKLIRWQVRRARTAMIWGRDSLASAPIVFGNAMAKSGSHLLIQILEGLVPLGPFVNPGFPPVNRFEDNRKLMEKQIVAGIKRMRPGDIRYGYIVPEKPYFPLLTGKNRATIFIYRDPRDLLVSHVFYATDMYKEHALHPYLSKSLSTMEERLNAVIAGIDIPGFEFSNVLDRYESYWGWFDHPGVLCLPFEDLILNREQAIGKLLDYICGFDYSLNVSREVAIETVKDSIAPKRSGTFRKGQPGNWKEHFTQANKDLFKEVAGDLLVRLGYEASNDW
jgi:hypothetical protein